MNEVAEKLLKIDNAFHCFERSIMITSRRFLTMPKNGRRKHGILYGILYFLWDFPIKIPLKLIKMAAKE